MTHPQLRPFQIDLATYHRMVELGILGEDDSVELIEGQIVTMSPKGSRHAACLAKINDWLTPKLSGQAQLRLQDPIQIPDLSEPEPDLALVLPRADYYLDGHPLPKDVILLAEIAESSLKIDREVKVSLYARAGISAYWIINLVDGIIEVHQQPMGDRYKEVTMIQPEEIMVVPVLGLEFKASDWLL